MNNANEQLMTDVLDGVADAEAVVRLAAVLANDPESRTQFEQARLGGRAFESLGTDEMPSGLRDEILREARETAIEAETEAHRAEAPRRPRRMLRARPAFRLALPFAAGAVATMLVAGLVTDFWRIPASERLPVQGAMRLRTERNAVDLGGARASLLHERGLAIVRLQVNEPGVSRAELSFDPDRFETSSVRWIRGPGGAVGADGGHVRLVFHGRGTCEVGLRAVGKDPVSVEVTWSGASGSRQATLAAAP